MSTRFEIASPVIEAELAKPYVVGVSDCFVFGCRVADVFDPGRRMAERYAGTYTTLRGAQRVLRRHGYRSLEEGFADHLERCGPASARFGDLGIVHLEDGEHVAVFTGQRFLTKTPAGRSLHELTAVKTAFRT